MNIGKKKRQSIIKNRDYLSKLKDAKFKKSFYFFKALINTQLDNLHKKELKIDNFDKKVSPSVILINESSKKEFSKEQLKILESYGKIDYEPYIDRNLDLMVYAIKKFKASQNFIKINNISNKSLMLFCAVGKIVQYPKGSCIYLRHHESKEFFFIIKGEVSIRATETEKIKEMQQSRKSIDNIPNINNSFERSETNSTIKNIDQEKLNNSFNIYNSFSNSSPKQNKENEETLKYFEGQTFKSVAQRIKLRQKSVRIKKENSDNNENNHNNTSNNFQKNNSAEMNDIYLLHKNLSYNINTYGEGNFFGEWDLVNNRDRLNSVFAEEDTVVLVLYKEYFKKYFQTEIINSDYAKKLFIRRHIPCLNLDFIPYISPELHKKNDIIYTEYDYAKEFFIIFKGSGVLKKLINAKNKKDILLNVDKMKILLLLDKGSIIGAECSKKGNFYENTFMICENNTFLFRINIGKIQLSKETKSKLIEFLSELYIKQKKLIQDCVFNNFNEEEKNLSLNKKKEEKANTKISRGIDKDIKTLYNVECAQKPMKFIINKLDNKVNHLIKSCKTNKKIVPKLSLNNIEAYEDKKNKNYFKHIKFNSLPEKSSRDYSSYRTIKLSILTKNNINSVNNKTSIKLTKRSNVTYRLLGISKFLKDTIQTSRSRNNNIYYNSGLFNMPFLTVGCKRCHSKSIFKAIKVNKYCNL